MPSEIPKRTILAELKHQSKLDTLVFRLLGWKLKSLFFSSFAPASEDIPLNKNASSNMSMNSAANIAAIQIEAVDTLKKKLE